MKSDLDFEAPIAELEATVEKLKRLSEKNKGEYGAEIEELEEKVTRQRAAIYSKLTPWQTVQVARHPDRPVLQDYIKLLFDDFLELHGDRCFGDDPALIGGFARIGDRSIMLIGHNRGKNTEENLERNFGMAKPEGYRKALRLMKLAEKARLPVVTFIDTFGAYPGLDAEERGQAEAIARNLTEMSRLGVPIICVVTGEGGSGGALGIGVGDVVMMLSHAIYSVISPEGCASILWRDAKFSADAAEALKLTAKSLHKLGICDQIVEEPVGGAHKDPEGMAARLKQQLLRHLGKLQGVSAARLVSRRFRKYAGIGQFNEA